MDDDREDSLYNPLETEETQPLELERGQPIEPEGSIPNRLEAFMIAGKELTLKSEDDEVTVCLGEDQCIPLGLGDEVYGMVKSLLDGLKEIDFNGAGVLEVRPRTPQQLAEQSFGQLHSLGWPA